MSTETNSPAPTTSDQPTPTSSGGRSTNVLSSSAASLTSSKGQPTSTPAEPSTTGPPPPPPTSTESSAEPSSTVVSSIDPPTHSDTQPIITPIDPSTTSFITSPTISPSPSASATSAVPTIAPISPGGLPNGAKLGLAIGLPVVFGLALLMGLVHYGRKRYQNNKENKKRIQDIKDQARLSAFQSQMAQVAPAESNRRGSAMVGTHSGRFADVQQDSVQHSRRYQPYSREGNYRGW